MLGPDNDEASLGKPDYGSVTTLAGSEQWGFVDGTGQAVRFKIPTGLWRDGSVLDIADSGNLAIRKLDLQTGQVTTFVDHLSTSSLWGDGGFLYTISCGGSCIAAIEMASGIVTVIAGGRQGTTTSSLAVSSASYAESGATEQTFSQPIPRITPSAKLTLCRNG
jgi:hypothetical protein